MYGTLPRTLATVVVLAAGAFLAPGSALGEDDLPLLTTAEEVRALDTATTRAHIDPMPGMIPLLVDRCPGLVELHIQTDGTIPVEELRALGRLRNLHRLRIYGNDGSFWEEEYVALGRLTTLRTLDLTFG